MPHYDCSHAECPSRDVLALIANKWTVLVLGVLLDGTTRFNELRRRVGGVSQKMLTQTLRDLERRGLITREIFPEIPPRVEYSLTSLGRSLVKVLDAVTAWAEAHTGDVLAAQQRFEARRRAAAR